MENLVNLAVCYGGRLTENFNYIRSPFMSECYKIIRFNIYLTYEEFKLRLVNVLGFDLCQYNLRIVCKYKISGEYKYINIDDDEDCASMLSEALRRLLTVYIETTPLQTCILQHPSNQFSAQTAMQKGCFRPHMPDVDAANRAKINLFSAIPNSYEKPQSLPYRSVYRPVRSYIDLEDHGSNDNARYWSFYDLLELEDSNHGAQLDHQTYESLGYDSNDDRFESTCYVGHGAIFNYRSVGIVSDDDQHSHCSRFDHVMGGRVGYDSNDDQQDFTDYGSYGSVD